jgi:Putative Ig domain
MRFRVGSVAVALLALTILAVPGRATAAPSTSSTVTISGLVGLLQATAGHGWAAHPDQTAGGTEQFVQGPLIPPRGIGSLEMTVATAADRALIFTIPFPGADPTPPPDLGVITPTPWPKLTGSFSTFTRNANPGPSLPVLKIVGYQQFNNAHPLQSQGFTTLNFEGAKQTQAPAANVWQTWRLGPTSRVWQSNETADPGFCPQATPCTLAEFAAHYPNGAWGQIQVGLGGGLTQATSYVDDVQISNGTSTITYDFEPHRPSITTTTLPDGFVNVHYSATLIATGGTAPYKWSLAAGALPRGLTLSPAGLVAGTPTTQGVYDFTVKVTDAAGHSTTKPLTLVIASAPPLPHGAQGYQLTAGDGGVFTFGHASFRGSAANAHLVAPVVGIATTPDGSGYWLTAKDGGVFSYGVPFHGSLGNVHPAAPIVGIAATPDGAGYYLVAADGGVFTFGDAHFKGSLGNVHLAAPIVGMAVTRDNQGYYLVGADGGVFAFGDAHFQGSLGATPPKAAVAGIAVDNATLGYWLVLANGALFAFGSPSFGSLANTPPAAPVAGIAATQNGLGYRFVGSDGGVFCFGTAAFLGSLANTPLTKPAVGMASVG